MARERILLLGLMGRFPLAGIGWQTLHHLVALTRLGFDVFYVEDSGAPPYDPRTVGLATEADANVAFVRSVLGRTQAPDHWAYYDALEDRVHGLGRAALDELYATCDQIWNLSGATRLRAEHARASVRVYVQTDPGFEQVRLAQGDASMAGMIDAHDVLFSYGENLAHGTSSLPTAGRTWHPTRPPVLLDEWQAPPPAVGASFSTVGSWENTGKDVAWQGQRLDWSKHAGFESVRDVPRHAREQLRVATTPPAARREAFERAGWRFRDPFPVSADLDAYRAFLHESSGEFTPAKDVYVATRSGWFSDRSACYLASGRPVITPETGSPVEAGSGLRTFTDAHEAADALSAVRRDLARESEAARVIAERCFDAERVLSRMLETIERQARRRPRPSS